MLIVNYTHFLFQYYFVSKIKISLCTLGWLWTSEPPASPYWVLKPQMSATIHAIKLKPPSLTTVLPTIGKNKIRKHYDCHSIFFHFTDCSQDLLCKQELSIFNFILLVLFENRSHYAALAGLELTMVYQANLKLMIHFLLTPDRWD